LPNRLRFRAEEELTESLADAGFVVERVYSRLRPPPLRRDDGLVRRREIPCIRLGRRVVVPRRALDEIVGSLPSERRGDKTA
jgi:hypothetical protein